MRTIAAAVLVLAWSAPRTRAADWPEWRGPGRDGVSTERGLPTRWSPKGENLAWTAPYGSRSAPVVLGDRLYLLHGAGDGAQRQESVVCLDADTGKRLWEHRFKVFLSDVPPHRVAWASPAVDPATGNVYAFGVGAHLIALSKDGKRLWERSLTEEFGAITTHGGRTVSPVIEGDLVIVSTLTSGWGDHARGNNRYFAFDKKSGEGVWVSSPQGRHYDTNYSTPVPATVGGKRLLVVGGSDGTIHALKAQTGEAVWKYEMSKRAILTSVVVRDGIAYASQSEENLDTSEMGQLAALDAAASGAIGKEQIRWRVNGAQGGFSSPLLDDGRLYQVDNGANLLAFDATSGQRLWTLNLGTIQKASPVLADGKLYVGTENGKFFILQPGPDKAEVLDEDWLGSEAEPEPVVASPAVARGRVYVASMKALYAIGKKRGDTQPAPRPEAALAAPADAAAAHLQVVPAEVLVKPGDHVTFRARLFDDQGRFIREANDAAWSVDGIWPGSANAGAFVAGEGAEPHAGIVKASLGSLSASARVRVIPPLPLRMDFDKLEDVPAYWINATGKYALRPDASGKVLAKLADNPFTRRGRVFLGPPDWSGYTVQVDVKATEKRRQMGDGGVFAQRYGLVLFGNNQRLELQGWQPNTAQTTSVTFAWKPDIWYRLKLRVENRAGGAVWTGGKAWPAADPEPPAWTVEHLDTAGHRNGSPGLYADAPFEVFFDNLEVVPNAPTSPAAQESTR